MSALSRGPSASQPSSILSGVISAMATSPNVLGATPPKARAIYLSSNGALTRKETGNIVLPCLKGRSPVV
jgi:hypothetical protein